MSLEFRYYQKEADDAIYEELLINNKCIVKMFCGTGKSLLMRKCRTTQNQNLVVYVFPSLSLIDQFCNDYFDKKDKSFCVLKVSSESDSTTDPAQITKFLKKKSNKIICVTYQSYKTLLDNLGSNKINVCIYDEAHHAVGETYQKLIFEQESEASVIKQIFFTATPKNANGIIMYDRENINSGMCGRMVYDYSYLKGMNEDYLNPFEIRVDMYTANTNYSIYESIARAILISGNNRVLTFHADVNTDRDTSVNNFVNEAEFVNAFCKVLMEEFPEKEEAYTTFKMIGLDASIKPEDRVTILKKFDTTPDNEVYIISSCETIGEGIDTKKANMCVFADPKSSFVKIIQNIGRIVRRQAKISTILIPCWVDKEKYIGCDEDKEKCDEVIRTDLNKDGNFNGILNVLSALKQEDEDLYDACLYYGEEDNNKINKSASVEEDDDSDSDNEDDEDDNESYDYEDDEDNELPINPKFKINVNFHTNDEIKILWKISSDIDIMKNMCSCVLDCEVEKYDPMEVAIGIVERGKEREINGFRLLPRHIQNKQNRTTTELEQQHKDAGKLGRWKKALNGKGDTICSDEVRDYLDENLPDWRSENDLDEKAMEDAKNIVERANERFKNGGKLIPKHIIKKKNRKTLELEQEYKDALKLGRWKQALKGNGKRKCSNKLCKYLDENLPEWKSERNLDEKSMDDAKNIIERAKKRAKNGFRLLPREMDKVNRKTPELEQEYTDAQKLCCWKRALKGNKNWNCSDEVRNYLDDNLPGWRTEIDFDEKAIEDAKNIVFRKNQRPNLLPRQISKTNRTTPELEQEYKDATKLGNWKQALKGKGNRTKCPDDVRDYLDENLPGWRVIDDDNTKSSSSSSSEPKEVIEEEEEIIITPKPKPKKITKQSKKEKSYEEMTENERRAFIEKHLQKHKEKKGYNSTNPDDKDKLNEAFSTNISIETEGKVIFLDHIEFKTAYSLLESGIKPEDMIIPQRIENYFEMQQHEIFGKSVVLEEFNDTLNRLEKENIKIKGVYADYCSTLEKDGLPFLELMLKIKEKNLLSQNAILGVTITLRNPEGVRFQGQDITIMEKKILRTFPNNENMLLKSNLTTDDEGYTYGNGAPMATWIFQVKN